MKTRTRRGSMAVLALAGLAAVLLAGATLAGAEGGKPYLGVTVGDVPPALQAHLEIERGALIVEVAKDSPASKAGLRPYDVVVAVKSGETRTEVRDARHFVELVARHQAGDRIGLEVRRGVKTVELTAELGARPDSAPGEKRAKPGFLGIRYEPVPEALAAHLGLEEGHGVLVAEVIEKSAAAKAGIRKNDVILAIDGKEITSPEDLHDALEGRKAGETVEIELVQQGKRRTLKVTLGERPEGVSDDFLPPLLPPPPEGYWRWEFPRSLRGRIIIRDPEGKERVIELPDLKGELEDFGDKIEREIEEKLRDLEQEMPELRDHLDRLVDKIERELREKRWRLEEDEGEAGKAGKAVKIERRVHAYSKVAENGWEVTARNDDGKITLTVRKDGETVAEDISPDGIRDLPAEARPLAERAVDSVRNVEVKVEIKTGDEKAGGGPPAESPRAKKKEKEKDTGTEKGTPAAGKRGIRV